MAWPLRRLSAVSLIAVLGLVAAACGGGAEASTDGVASLEGAQQSASTTTVADEVSSDDVEQAVLAFAACMRDHGVEMEDPTVSSDGTIEFGFRAGGGGEGDVDRNTLRAARDECSEHLESVTLGFRRGDDSEIQDLMVEYAQCMRDHGYQMDDPDFSGLGPGGEGEEGDPRSGPFGVIDPDDPAFQSAQTECEDILAGFGRPPGTGRGGASDNN